MKSRLIACFLVWSLLSTLQQLKVCQCSFNKHENVIFQQLCVAFLPKPQVNLQICLLNAYPYKKEKQLYTPCILYVSCQISGAVVTQQVGKCHCSLQCLQEGCHTLDRSQLVWPILTAPIHHCWACWLSLHNHSNLPQDERSHTLSPSLTHWPYTFFSFIL